MVTDQDPRDDRARLASVRLAWRRRINLGTRAHGHQKGVVLCLRAADYRAIVEALDDSLPWLVRRDAPLPKVIL